MLGPCGRLRQVVAERVAVVGRLADPEQGLVGKEHDQEGEERGSDGIGEGDAERGSGAGERRTRSAARPPGAERSGEQQPFGDREACPRHLVDRREDERRQAEVRDQREVGGEQGRDETREACSAGCEERGRDGRPNQECPDHGSSLARFAVGSPLEGERSRRRPLRHRNPLPDVRRRTRPRPTTRRRGSRCPRRARHA